MPQSKVTGEVLKQLTSPTNLRGNYIATSVNNPEYVVRSDKTGNEAAHQPDTLSSVQRKLYLLLKSHWLITASE
ncbi:DUF2945 domain-containing protein [Nostoc sp. MG11]|uniref:DUF2945 domain-containing protein n=1 Tax=Nostoc sp. MG11 TaxID=2721166 RepID=UPI0018664C93|nr:DUF2945 domain-containing protein [Nostoc sp. MG11]